MYIRRDFFATFYRSFVSKQHALSPPVLILAALEPDALCACRILSALLKRDYIPHKIKPIAGYAELAAAGEDMVKPMRMAEGGSGGVVVCLGVGGLVDLAQMLGLEQDDGGNVDSDGVAFWVFDGRRPYNLANVFGAVKNDSEQAIENNAASSVSDGQLLKASKADQGGIVVWDDGDIQHELDTQRTAHFTLERMRREVTAVHEINGYDSGSDDSQSDHGSETSSSHASSGRKRKSWELGQDDSGSEQENDGRPARRRRSNSSSPIPSSPRGADTGSSSYQRHAKESTPPSNQLSSQPDHPPTPVARPSRRQQRRAFLRERHRHAAVIEAYHTQGTSYSEPVSSLMYSLASDLGREDNDLLWLAIVGVSSTEVYGRTATGFSLTNHDREYEVPSVSLGWTGSRGYRIRQLLRDETKRLNPPELNELGHEITRGHATDVIQTHAKSPTDTAIRLSPEPRFLLIRHWSLYDSMLHSPYLSARLHVWSDAGRRRLHKLLAKMGVSLTQSKQTYTHMEMELKKVLRERLLHVAPMYGLDGLVPPPANAGNKEGWGFVRSWGWKACLSAADVAILIGAILDVDYHRLSSLSHARAASNGDTQAKDLAEDSRMRFYTAYDALLSPTDLTAAIPVAQSLYRSVLRTGTSLLHKRQIRHLRAFRMGLIKEGPDLALFCAPGALTKLALWLGEAVAEVEPENRVESEKNNKSKKALTPLVLGCLNEDRGLYVVVGLGGGGNNGFRNQAARKEREEKRKARAKEKEQKRDARRREKERRREERGEEEHDDEEDETEEDSEASSSDSDESDTESSPKNRNRFGVAFSEAASETNARVKQDSFEHCVIEVKKEDLSGFLEHLSQKAVIG